MNEVIFNHDYSKLRGQKSGFLVWATLFHMDKTFPEETYLYDTDGKYQFEMGKDYLQLVFLGDKDIPFTTYRELTETNKLKYFHHIGEIFKFEINKE